MMRKVREAQMKVASKYSIVDVDDRNFLLNYLITIYLFIYLSIFC